jgi:alkyl hydroperoxide reductase subunit AhpC
VPALEALVDKFAAAHVQPMGVSVDSIHCHANWAQSLGGVSFPLLADFHPKGAVASDYGVYLDEAGITDRATVIIDAQGIVRHASSVTPAGQRDMGELLSLCKSIDGEHGGDLPAAEAPAGLPEGTKLFVKSSCGHSKRVLTAAENLGVLDRLAVFNVSEDQGRRAELENLAGSDQAPCLTTADALVQDSQAIIEKLVRDSTGLWTAD